MPGNLFDANDYLKVCGDFVPLSVDPYVAASVLQKSIRRGEGDLAERAALTLFRQRPAALWRRLGIVAFEDVGAGDAGAVVATTTACTDPHWRDRAGGDEIVVRYLARLLADSVKDRSADYLICSAKAHPMLDDARAIIQRAPPSRRLAIVADTTQPLSVRAVAAWMASGIDQGRDPRAGSGDLSGLLSVFRSLGVPEPLINATRCATGRARDPIVIMPALVWSIAFAGERPGAVKCPVPPASIVDDLPLWALDKHTRAGRAAIHRFARENDAVRETLEEHVAEFRAVAACEMAAFYVDGTPIARRLDWSQSADLHTLGIGTDMLKVGVPPEGIAPILTAVHDNLDHLNAIRARLFRPSRSGSAS